MTTAAGVPETRGELEGDEAFETLRSTGRVALLRDAVVRFRAADGFSHSRALAFQLTLTLLPALIALVGLTASLDEGATRRTLQDAIDALAPGAVGDILRTALREGADGSGATALVFGLIAAVFAGTTAMAQLERGANRLYGVERDRPFLRRYGTAFVLALIAGTLVSIAVGLLVAGKAFVDGLGPSDTAEDLLELALWPVGLAAVITAIGLLFEVVPNRRQPEASWLALGGGVAAVLFLLVLALLDEWLDAAGNFGDTYGSLAGTVGLLLWTFGASASLLLGLAVCAQLEAVRAGAPLPRVDRSHNL